ncbi:MAG: response regulator [Ketobacteraceae bacterium]|nr:response regulator [Ketobacteraceae bacterium]
MQPGLRQKSARSNYTYQSCLEFGGVGNHNMGKIQYRVLVLTFLGFVIAMIGLGLSVYVTMGDLIRADIRSSLEAARNYKIQYLRSWITAERDSFDNVYIGPELAEGLYSFVKSPPALESDYVETFSDIRSSLVSKVDREVDAELSVVIPGGEVKLSSNLELVGRPHPFWFSNQYTRRTAASGESRVFIRLADSLEMVVIRNLYYQGSLYAYLVLQKTIPDRFAFELAQHQPGRYQIMLYGEDRQAYSFSYQEGARQFEFNVDDALQTEPSYWLEPDGWSPVGDASMVGVWGWDPVLDMGVAVVAESRSVFRILRISQNINLGFMICIVAASVIIAWFFQQYQKHRLYLESQLEQALQEQARDLSAERREKQTLVEALFQNSSDGYLVIKPGEVLECNPASKEMLGLESNRELVGKSPFQYSPVFQSDGSISIDHAEQLLHKAFETGFERFEWEFETRQRTRLYCWVTITIVKYYGEMVGIMVWQNMTKAIESEKVLRDSERKSRAILNSTNHVLFVLDPQGFIVDLNTAAAEWLGEKREELLNISYWDVSGWLLDEDLTRRIRDSFNEASRGDTVRFEVDTRVEGQTHYFDFVVTPIRDEHHALVMVIMEAYDITQIRIAELAEKRARQLAEEVSQTKTNFLANMSHEIRTPMNAIIGLTKLCLKTQLNGRQRTMLESIDQASETLLNILNDILDFSKVESGKLEIELVTFSIDDVLQTVSGLFALKAEEKHIEFVVSNKTDRMNLIGDPLRIQQVLMNLCSNAIKFTREGEVLLTVEMLEQNHDRGIFRFSVRDTGVGLSQSQQARLFEAFSQADTSTTRQFGGTGLGLAICKELVELMGGAISVESEQGKGSCFYFDLPLALLDDSEDPFEAVGETAAETIAIVDDNLVCIEVEKKIVRRLGYQARVFSSAEELLTALENAEYPVDIILMDWDMPGMDGCEAAMHIKNRMGGNAPAIILVTGVKNEISPQLLAHYRLDGFVIKPVNPDVLAHVIDEARQLGARTPEALGLQPELSPPARQEAVRVLVVEDNDINQMVVSNFLEETGVEAVVVANGQEAVDYIEQQETLVDAVLMDLQMPVMDGFTATEILRKKYDAQTLPVIAMTANVLTSDKERAKAIGMNDIISKPIDFQNFEWILGQWVDLPASFVAKQAEVVTDLESIAFKGVDFQFGLKQLGSDKGLYASLLLKFNEEFPQALDAMKNALYSGSEERLEEVAHRMKGVAGNLGFSGLRRCLRDIEDGAREGLDVKPHVLEIVEHWPATREVIEKAIDLLVEEGDEIEASVATDRLVNYLNDVSDRLHRHEVLPRDEVRHLKYLLLNHLDEKAVTQFIRAIDSFQMEEALGYLVNFVEQLLSSENN